MQWICLPRQPAALTARRALFFWSGNLPRTGSGSPWRVPVPGPWNLPETRTRRGSGSGFGNRVLRHGEPEPVSIRVLVLGIEKILPGFRRVLRSENPKKKKMMYIVTNPSCRIRNACPDTITCRSRFKNPKLLSIDLVNSQNVGSFRIPDQTNITILVFF